ncbi:MAG: carbonic anhydrase [Maioricimonas sp. JB049]
MEKLLRGINEFQAKHFGSQRELFERLATGQKPEALFITCSDSRIDPSLLTQTKPGELFILRNAGNIVPRYGVKSGECATIEYAIRALGIRDIIICGHTHCGAMQGLVSPEALEKLPATRDWLSHAEATQNIIRERYGDESGDNLLTAAVKENVLVQLKNLRTHPSVEEALSQGQLNLHGWVYRFETGHVFAFDPEQKRYTALAHPGATPPDAVATTRIPTI